jgi:hypothetical protein
MHIGITVARESLERYPWVGREREYLENVNIARKWNGSIFLPYTNHISFIPSETMLLLLDHTKLGSIQISLMFSKELLALACESLGMCLSQSCHIS